jgi:arylsulfatase A-like enzyme
VAYVAEREGPVSLVLFGTVASAKSEAQGFLRPVKPRTREPFAWGRRTIEILVDGEPGSARDLVLDLQPAPRLRGQSAAVSLNGQDLGRLALVRGRRRYLLKLPSTRLAGENRLRLVFEQGAEMPGTSRLIAASFFSMASSEPGDPRLAALVKAGAPRLLSVRGGGRGAALVQAAPSALHFALRLPGRAQLRFTPGGPGADAGVRMRVTFGLQGEAERELWQGSPDGKHEEIVSLPGAEGGFARLSLHAETSEPRSAAAVWTHPRVLGDGDAGLELDPREEEGDSRTARLRAALRTSNVLLVILDAAGAKHFGCYGYERRTTPEIDRIAAEGVLFERAYTPAVYTLAAMSSLWTSRYPDQHRNVSQQSADLGRARLTLPDVLAAAGVPAVAFVANAMAGPAFGFERSFTEFHEMYAHFGARTDATAFREVVPPWLDAHRGSRFFLYLHFREPHAPYDPPPPFNTMFGPDAPIPKALRQDQVFFEAITDRRHIMTPDEVAHTRRLYDGNLASADREIGALRRALEARGLWNRTVLILTGDHGEALWEHHHIGHNSQVYEESAHIPFVVHLPEGAGPSGLRVPGLTDLLDVAPTIADVFGLRGQGGATREFVGKTVLPMLFGGRGKEAIVVRSLGAAPFYGLRHEGYKYVLDTSTGREELYDLDADPGEATSLDGTLPLRAAWYRQALGRAVLGFVPDSNEEAGPATMTPSQRETLRALGYAE